MKKLQYFKHFENNFYADVNEEKIVKYLQSKLDFITGKSKQDINLSSLIYNFIIRATGKENKQLKEFATKTASGWQSVISHYLNSAPSSVLKFYPNPDKENIQWLEAKFNRTNTSSDKTYNYYITFTQTEDNLKKWFNSVSKLINKFFEWCKQHKDFECGFKFGSDSSYYTTEKDHLKFYYYDSKNKNKIEELVKEWLKENSIKTDARPYSHALDAKDSTGKKTSFGDLASTQIANELEKLMKQYKDKFTAKQYFDWLIKFMSSAKYNLIEK